MRPGLGHVIAGAALLAAGVGVTFTSNEAVWYGAIVVGLIEIARGLYALAAPRPPEAPADGADDPPRP